VRLRIAPNLLTISCRLAKQYYPDANITVDVQLSILFRARHGVLFKNKLIKPDK